ncbi:MAG: hypothetical protein IJO37_08315 [Ruminiclostridium sp.]|nr:hypothetical protein [Ruminiclostridium sp.]
MNKLFAVLLGAAIMLSLVACSGSDEPKTEEVENVEVVVTMDAWANDGLSTEEIQREGLYTGQVIDGVPNGSGRFDTHNNEGEPWYYEGDFENGTFNGNGVCVWPESDPVIREAGTYVDGRLEPTLCELMSIIPSYTLNSFELSEVSAEFIKAHENLFPCASEDAIAEAISLTDETIEYKHLTKNVTPYKEVLFCENGLEVVQVFEYGGFGYTYTWIYAVEPYNYEYNGYLFYYIGSVDVYEGDRIDVRALPIAGGGFDNVSGGQTNVVTALVSIMDVR